MFILIISREDLVYFLDHPIGTQDIGHGDLRRVRILTRETDEDGQTVTGNAIIATTELEKIGIIAVVIQKPAFSECAGKLVSVGDIPIKEIGQVRGGGLADRA